MKIEQFVKSVAKIKGVYATFHTCHEGRRIIAQVPDDWNLEIAQSLARRCIETFTIMQQDISDCHEVRIDSDFVSLLIYSADEGYLISLVNEPQLVGEAQDYIEALVRKYSPELTPLPAETSSSHLAPTVTDPTATSPGPKLPIPTITMPVTVNAARSAARYINEKPIGEGGTAVVCKAYDLRLNREVALKRFKKQDEQSEGNRDYLAEMESASRIRHHNVLSTFDADIDMQGRYIVMQLIDGMDLEKRIAESVLNAKFQEFAIQTLEGLHATHEAGLLHLDLKPSNIMISEGTSGHLHATLIDFGRAQRLASEDNEKPPKGAGLDGSLHYCSPEFINGLELDARADLYSLGCVFYFALTGKIPFEGDTPVMIMASHIQGIVTDIREHLPNLEERFAAGIMQMIALDPKDRPASTQEAMQHFVTPEAKEAKPSYLQTA